MTRAEYRAQITQIVGELSAILALLLNAGVVHDENSPGPAERLAALNQVLADGCKRTGDDHYAELCQSVMQAALRQLTFLKVDASPRSYRVLLKVRAQLEQQLTEVGGRRRVDQSAWMGRRC